MSPGVRTCMAVTAVVLMGGCSHLPHWSWHRKAPPPPTPVHELVITAPDGQQAAFSQYWKGNTLVIDLQPGGASGQAVMRPREHTLWPVRLSFRVMPGQFAVLEVTAKQRVVLPITPSGTHPVDLELDPGVFVMKSPQINVSWGAAPQAEDITGDSASQSSGRW